MKKLYSMLVIGIVLAGLSIDSFSQSQVVFTSSTEEYIHKFWRVNVATPTVFDNISQKLDLIAPLQGEDYGPITVSRDGNWYAFTSERFDADAQGWAALTITNADFSTYEVVHDSTGLVIHTEGLAQVFSGGNAIVFVADFGNHSRDVFVIYKNGSNWGMPINLTAGSPYGYNYYPYLSADGSKVLFDAGDSSFPSTAIGEMNIDGSGLTFPITAASMTNGIAAHSPCYGNDGSIIYEGDASGETLWKLPNGSFTPAIINASNGNDNSPVTLLDGKIASLWLPNDWHQIKIMNADGTNGYMLTDSSALFTEVFDIGISTGTAYIVGVEEISSQPMVEIFPNPSNGNFRVTAGSIDLKAAGLEIYNLIGEKVYTANLEQTTLEIDISDYPKGVYVITIYNEAERHTEKIIVQ